MPALFVDVQARLAELQRSIGIDRTAEATRVELEPAELDRRLRQALKAGFVRQPARCRWPRCATDCWRGRPRRACASLPGLCEGNGVIEGEAAGLIDDLVEAVAEACPAA